MLQVEYANPETNQRSPRLGRISAFCNGGGVAIYAAAIVLDGFGLVPDAVAGVVIAVIYLLFLAATVTGAAAVIRPQSRTVLAWITVSINLTFWLFIVVAYLAM